MKFSKNKMAGTLFAAAAAVCIMNSGLCGIGVRDASAAVVSSQEERPERKNGEKPEEKGTRYTGKITAVSSSSITVTLGEMNRPDKKENDGTASEKREKPKDDGTAAEKREKPKNGEKPEGLTENGRKQGEMPEIAPEKFITLTDETKTIKISDSTKFRSKGQEASVSDLKAGDYISFLVDDDGAVLEVSTDIMRGGRGAGGQRQEKVKESSASGS